MPGAGSERWSPARALSEGVSGRRRGSAPGAGRQGRGPIHRRRVRHPDPVGEADRRARDLARRSGYRIPPARGAALGSLHRAGHEVLRRQGEPEGAEGAGFSYLRPLQMAYESKKFMLPIRLGMANADGPQDLVVYTLTRKGRVETHQLPDGEAARDMEVPLFVKEEFADVYQAIFTEQARRERGRRRVLPRVRLGHGGGATRVPPTPSPAEELSRGWAPSGSTTPRGRPRAPIVPRGLRRSSSRASTSVTTGAFPGRPRLPGDGRPHELSGAVRPAAPVPGTDAVRSGPTVSEELRERRRQEARTLADLTGWNLDTIRGRMGPDASGSDGPWYRKNVEVMRSGRGESRDRSFMTCRAGSCPLRRDPRAEARPASLQQATDAGGAPPLRVLLLRGPPGPSGPKIPVMIHPRHSTLEGRVAGEDSAVG